MFASSQPSPASVALNTGLDALSTQRHETNHIEFKSLRSGQTGLPLPFSKVLELLRDEKRGKKEMNAMVNTVGGGTIFYGKTDDGTTEEGYQMKSQHRTQVEDAIAEIFNKFYPSIGKDHYEIQWIKMETDTYHFNVVVHYFNATAAFAAIKCSGEYVFISQHNLTAYERIGSCSTPISCDRILLIKTRDEQSILQLLHEVYTTRKHIKSILRAETDESSDDVKLYLSELPSVQCRCLAPVISAEIELCDDFGTEFQDDEVLDAFMSHALQIIREYGPRSARNKENKLSSNRISFLTHEDYRHLIKLFFKCAKNTAKDPYLVSSCVQALKNLALLSHSRYECAAAADDAFIKCLHLMCGRWCRSRPKEQLKVIESVCITIRERAKQDVIDPELTLKIARDMKRWREYIN